jgi:hypothetical protein
VPDYSEVARGTLESILEQAQLTKDDFLQLWKPKRRRTTKAP